MSNKSPTSGRIPDTYGHAGRDNPGRSDGRTGDAAFGRVKPRDASGQAKWIEFGYGRILVALVALALLAGGCGGAPAARCEADIIVNGIEWHAATPKATCTVTAMADEVGITLDDGHQLTLRVPLAPGHFATGAGQGFAWTDGNMHPGVGDWVSTGQTWELTFNADDGYPLGGSVRWR